MILTQLCHNGLNLCCGVHSCYLFNNLPIFFKEQGWDGHNAESTRCFWIFIHIHFNDFQNIF